MNQDADKAWIETFTGKKFHVLAPQQEEICIEDIAHALANQVRFTGHVREFYSVAQHSVYVSELVAPEHAKWGLLHDAPEAYISDLNRPTKYFTEIGPAFQCVEAAIMDAIALKFGLCEPEPEAVRAADNLMLYAERNQLLGKLPWDFKWGPEVAANIQIYPLLPKVAEDLFLERFFELQISEPSRPTKTMAG